MSEGIGIKRLEQLIEEGAQLVEVLPEREFQEEHLPAAINLPLKKLNAETAGALDRNRAVVVYCWDSL
jgi:rhodanese-related sulfurtransferase